MVVNCFLVIFFGLKNQSELKKKTLFLEDEEFEKHEPNPSSFMKKSTL
jgi:hypothetical protein